MKKPTSLLFFGGSSNERFVSVASAQNLSKTLSDAQCWFLSKTGQVFEVTREALAAHEKPFQSEFIPAHAAAFPNVEAALDSAKARQFVFILCFHGGEGEDGTLQAHLEKRCLPFTGSGSSASAQAMDKRRAKEVAQAAGLAVAKDMYIKASELSTCEKSLEKMFQSEGALILKPAGGGSTLGVHFIRSKEDVKLASQELQKGEAVDYLAETILVGRELTVGVANIFGETLALPPTEVILEQNRNFDYAGKYLGQGALEITPAEAPPAIIQSVQESGLKIHAALGCEGYSRSDFIVVGETPYYLETNTLPGMTRSSFIPQQLAAAGIPLTDFLESQIRLACQRIQQG